MYISRLLAVLPTLAPSTPLHDIRTHHGFIYISYPISHYSRRHPPLAMYSFRQPQRTSSAKNDETPATTSLLQHQLPSLKRRRRSCHRTAGRVFTTAAVALISRSHDTEAFVSHTLWPSSRSGTFHCLPHMTTSTNTRNRPARFTTMSLVPGINKRILNGKEDPTSTSNAPASPAPDDKHLPELNHDEVRRYSRHLILPDVGVKGQRQLKASSVLAVGTGGLGSPALLYLAAAGVGRLGVLDDDIVDESNLQRQIIHGTSTLGKPKVESARDRMLDVNPHVNVDIFEEKLTSENALRILDGYDVVLDGSDNFPTKYLVNDACEMLGIPNVYGAILGFEGQMSVFSYQGGPTYRDLMPTPPPPGLVPSCAEGGVLGILPGVVGCIQATEVIKILLGKGNVLSGRLLVYDALAMSFKESALLKIPNRPPITDLVDYQGFCGFSSSPPAPAPATGTLPGGLGAVDKSDGQEKEGDEGFERISPQEVIARMGEGWAPYVLDVRLPQEAEIASLPFVDSVCPHRKVATIVEQLPKDMDLLVHCKVGGRSAKACATLSEHGIPRSRLFNMEGGIIRWAKEVDASLAVY